MNTWFHAFPSSILGAVVRSALRTAPAELLCRCVVSFTRRTGWTTVQMCGQLYAPHRLYYRADVWSASRTAPAVLPWRCVVSFTHCTGCTTVQMCGQLYAPAALMYRCVVCFTHRTGCTTVQMCGHFHSPANVQCLQDTDNRFIQNISTSIPSRHHFAQYSVSIHRCVNFKYRNSKMAANATRM